MKRCADSWSRAQQRLLEARRPLKTREPRPLPEPNPSDRMYRTATRSNMPFRTEASDSHEAPAGLLALPREVRQQILLLSIDRDVLSGHSFTALPRYCARLRAVHPLISADMEWVAGQWRAEQERLLAPSRAYVQGLARELTAGIFERQGVLTNMKKAGKKAAEKQKRNVLRAKGVIRGRRRSHK